MSVIASLYPRIIGIDPGQTTGWSIIYPKIMWASTDGENVEPTLTGGTLINNWSHGQIDCGARRGVLDASEGTGDPLGGGNPMGECLGAQEIIELCREYPDAAIVVEDFIVDFGQLKKNRESLSPVRITAKLEQAMWADGRRIFLQDRSNTKTTMSDQRLKDIGLYERKGGLNHARDADRHAMYFLRRCQNSATLRYQAWPWIFHEPVVKVRKPQKKSTGDRIVFGD